jgi:hypothetical protein
MKGEKTPCIPSLVPVVQLAQPGKLFGSSVERNGALAPSFNRRASVGSRPSDMSGVMMSKVAPSSPMITVFMLDSREYKTPQRKDAESADEARRKTLRDLCGLCVSAVRCL